MINYYCGKLKFVTINLAIFVCSLSSGCGSSAPVTSVVDKTDKSATVGLIFRRQFYPDPYRERWLRHVDVILADGSLRSYGRVSGTSHTSLGLVFRYDPGRVWDQRQLALHNPFETDIQRARHNVHKGKLCPDVSEWITFKVSRKQADALRKAWDDLAAQAPPFRLFGQNCATRADTCLAEAGIVSRAGIAGIDRPSSLKKKIIQARGRGAVTIRVGFFGYSAQGKPGIEELPPQGSPAAKKLLRVLRAEKKNPPQRLAQK